MTAADGEHSEESAEQEAERSQQKPVDPRIYTVRISRAMGIGWGTDISFRWVYVRELDPSGPAANCGKISVGDQVTIYSPISKQKEQKKSLKVSLVPRDLYKVGVIVSASFVWVVAYIFSESALPKDIYIFILFRLLRSSTPC